MGRQLENFELEACAKAAHEVNRAYCEAMQDFSHLSWEATNSDLRTVAKHAVIGIVTNDHTAEQSHEAWVATKRAAGWTFGSKKNADKKEHPCLVAYKDLPFEQQVKDELWVTTVKALMGALWRIPA